MLSQDLETGENPQMAKVVLQQKPSWDVLESSPLLIGQLITNSKSGSNTVIHLNEELIVFATSKYNIATFHSNILALVKSQSLIIRVGETAIDYDDVLQTILGWTAISSSTPPISLIGRGTSIPRAIFQGRPCSNDTSLRTQHVLAIPEQAVLSHAEFVCHLLTSRSNCGVP